MYYIDGNNLESHTHHASIGTAKAEREVIEFLDRFANQQGKQVTLVFDGVRPTIPAKGNLRIVYPTSEDGDADNAIVRLLSEDPQRKNGIVVTGDQQLIRRVRELGAQVKSRIDFLNMLETPSRVETKPQIVSRRQADEWLSIFGIPPEQADLKIDSKRPAESTKPKKGKSLK